MDKLSIVLVDDEIWALVSLEKLFSRPELGFEVTGTFQSGEKALDFIADTQPNFAFLDIRMPNIDGIELAALIRKRSEKTSVVIISAFADFEYAQRAIRQGVLDFLVKPITSVKADQLLKELRAFKAVPDSLSTDVDARAPEDTFSQIMAYIDEHYAESLQLSKIAQMFFLNESYCSTLFRMRLGDTFTNYLRTLRLEKASMLLSRTSLPIKNISISVGYPDCLYFSRIFRRQYGFTPSEYRQINKRWKDDKQS